MQTDIIEIFNIYIASYINIIFSNNIISILYINMYDIFFFFVSNNSVLFLLAFVWGDIQRSSLLFFFFFFLIFLHSNLIRCKYDFHFSLIRILYYIILIELYSGILYDLLTYIQPSSGRFTTYAYVSIVETKLISSLIYEMKVRMIKNNIFI